MAEGLAATTGSPEALAPKAPAPAAAAEKASSPAGVVAATAAADAPVAALAKVEAPQPASGAAAATGDDPAAAPNAKAAPSPPGPFRLVTDSASMQGRGPTQEDRHVKIPDLTKAAKALKMPIDHLEQPCAFFGVYDGHRGHQCAEFAAKGFHMKLLKRLTATSKTCGTGKECAAKLEEAIHAALREVCEEIDAEFIGKFRTATDGCSLAVAFVTGARLHVAWLGNVRCLLGRVPSASELPDLDEDGLPRMALVAATEDHHPALDDEADRVMKAGGVVVDFGEGSFGVAHEGYEERIREIRRAQASGQGVVSKPPVCLPVSRALGDRDFKAASGKAILVPTPGVKTVQLDQSHKFAALVSGGISASMPDKDVVDELDLLHDPAEPLADVRAGCGALVQEAYKRESPENLTVILFRLLWTGAASYDRRIAKVEKAKREAAALLAAAEPQKAESAAMASKRRRLEAKESVKAQKMAAYNKSMSGSAGAANAAAEAKKEAEVAKMQAEVEAEKAEAAKVAAAERAERIKRAAEAAAKEEEEETGEGLDAAEAFFAARKAAKQAKTAGSAAAIAAKPAEVPAPQGLDAAEAFFAARPSKRAEVEAAATPAQPSGLDAAEAFFAARKATKVEAEASATPAQPSGLDAAEAFFAARKAAKEADAPPMQQRGMEAAEAFFAARRAKQAQAEGQAAAPASAALPPSAPAAKGGDFEVSEVSAQAQASEEAKPSAEGAAPEEAADDGLVFL